MPGMNEFLQKILTAIVAGSVGDGRLTVTTAGTAVRFPDQACTYVIITAEDNNTGNVVVGGSTVVAAQATRRGVLLEASRSEKIYVNNLEKLFLDSTVNGDGVTYAFFN